MSPPRAASKKRYLNRRNSKASGRVGQEYQGYQNLMKLTSAAHIEGFYYRPRVDKELLRECSEGLIASSACLHGEIASHIVRGNMDEARKAASEYRDIFGKENFYLEIMENGIPEQTIANHGLIELSKEFSILIATNDCHYLNPDHAEAHNVLLCIQTGKTIEDKIGCRSLRNSFIFVLPKR